MGLALLQISVQMIILWMKYNFVCFAYLIKKFLLQKECENVNL